MGKIKLDKDFLNWDYYNDPLTMRLFIHLSILTTEKPYFFRGDEIRFGQLVTSDYKLSRELRTVPRCISSSLSKLFHSRLIDYVCLNDDLDDPSADVEGPKVYRKAMIVSVLNQFFSYDNDDTIYEEEVI